MLPMPRSCSAETIAVALTLALGLGASSCSSPCDSSDDGNPPDLFTAGSVACAGNTCRYETSSWHGELLHFPGGKRYDLEHHLGVEPTDVHVYLAFTPDGVGRDEQSAAVAPSAGSSSVIQLVNDRVIRVKNDTCAEFWVRVTAEAEVGSAVVDAGGGDAAGDAAGD